MEANNQAVMALAKRLIDEKRHESLDVWTYYDVGIVKMTAELTGLSEAEVCQQLLVNPAIRPILEIYFKSIPEIES